MPWCCTKSTSSLLHGQVQGSIGVKQEIGVNCLIIRLCFRFAMKDGIMTAERKREICKEHIKIITNQLGHYIRLKAAHDSAFSFIDQMTIA